jgi:dethiobiotin synthetase
MMPRGFFVTGTDTGVGKTLAACTLLHALRQHCSQINSNCTALGMKAVAAGTETDERGRSFNPDVRALQLSSSFLADPDLVCPYVMAAPLSPHLSAELEGRSVEAAQIVTAYRQLAKLTDTVVVEGAGGFCVPLTLDTNGADLAREMGLPVVIVVGMRLGCLNHAMLTAQAVRASGLPIAGWIANDVTPEMPAREGNLQYLRHQFRTQYNAPLLGHLPWQADYSEKTAHIVAERLARHLDLSPLMTANMKDKP